MSSAPPDPAAVKVDRKLVTVLAADFVNFSRLMGGDEEATARILHGHRETTDGIIGLHGGRIFNTGGDSVFAEFKSPVEAVRAAVEIQSALKTRNDALPEDRRMLLRIGIHLGDVIIRGDDFLGDAVNIAARLESIAEPGGILISGSVHDQLAGKLNMSFEELGTPPLKNIARPISVFRIGEAAPLTRPKQRSRKSLVVAGIAAVLVLALAVGGFAFWTREAPPSAATVHTTTAASARAVVLNPEPKPGHWLNGQWALLVTREETTEKNFCPAYGDPRCRFFAIRSIVGDGSYEGVMGFKREAMLPSRFIVRGNHLSLTTPSNSKVEADLEADGTIRGRMKLTSGQFFNIVSRKLSD